jgi:hypothetical protein
MSWNDHDHRGEYAGERHDHDNDYAPLHHRHHDLEREDDRLQAAMREWDARLSELRTELEGALGRIRELEQVQSAHGETLDAVRNRVCALEHDTPQTRQLQYEADLAAADLAESGYDRHGRGCGCSDCTTGDEECPERDSGPERLGGDR